MPRDRFSSNNVPRPSNAQRRMRGALAYQSGLQAEDAVCAAYLARGYVLSETRWRGRAGEIDLIFTKDETYFFVEVKSSATHALAAQSLSARQLARICASAEDYISQTPKGFLTDMQIDVALVDSSGALEILQNATI
ncbi:YraN family protein [Pacificibacter sp. AS14]|uniref:YraN family protein n=1 Tax=Pacificibacter sp. AS14 TaxID=3135785 RepID=UPI00317351DC